MKKWIPVVAGLLVVGLWLVIYLANPRFLAAVSNQTYDMLLKLMAENRRDDSVVVVDIDDRSLEQIGQWPWPRFQLARLVEQSFRAGARVIVFDVVYADRDRLSPPQVLKTWSDVFGADEQMSGLMAEREDFDSMFAATVSRYPVVLGCYMNDRPVEGRSAVDASAWQSQYLEKGRRPADMLPFAHDITPPLPELASAGKIAFINTTVDNDNIIRRTPLIYEVQPDSIFPSLNLQAVRLFKGSPPFKIVYDSEGVEGVREVAVGDLVIPTDRHGRIVLNFRADRFPHVSAADIMRPDFETGLLSNRIVMVGTSAAALQDLVATPLAQDFPGIEVQATAVENILSGHTLWEPRWIVFVNLFLMALLGMAMTFFISRHGAVLSALVSLLAIAATVGASAWLLKNRQLVANPTEISLCLAGVYIAVTFIKYFLEEGARKRVRTMFGTMVSPEVLTWMEEHPDRFSLTGRRQDATVFFSDIASFTTIAEQMDPGVLSNLMNRYLTAVTEVIMEHGGYLNKFIGDGIMAVWGVPYDLEDHAVRACRAAIEQQRRLRAIAPEIKVEFNISIQVRMGLNTGIVTAGNMGSSRRFEYTVLGDVVNRASRFEGINKDYGTLMAIGQSTRDAIGGQFPVRLLDLVVVKGETRPVRIYELLLPEDAEALQAATSRYETALQLHWERRWDEALALLMQNPDDRPSRRLRERVERFKQQPPPAGWQGEDVKTSK